MKGFKLKSRGIKLKSNKRIKWFCEKRANTEIRNYNNFGPVK